MAGQHRDISDDGTYRVTIGSVDDPKYSDDHFFVSQQDTQGNHMTTIYDSQHNVVDTKY
ncbi:hypothetical protein [Blastococcus sp. TF02-09]|uniref:hypothetical protein n=1 Tax=Blastococcus sp. TF02-09 TaxID=2250576 RepID=UPI0013146C27|nr:hypothetical protein [Blastococcus sp. TF02-9]